MTAKKVFSISAAIFRSFAMHVVFDDRLHAETHVHRSGDDQTEQGEGDQWIG